jgi:hypothetical protein
MVIARLVSPVPYPGGGRGHQGQSRRPRIGFFTFSAQPGPRGIPDKVQQAHANQATETIVEVSKAGVRVIPILGLPMAGRRIVGVGLLNRPGSNQIDELAICSRLEEKPGACFSRHSLAGTLIGEVREIYANIEHDPRLDFPFLAQSNMLLAVGQSFQSAAFIWPNKPVNWFKKLTFGDGNHPFVFRGVVDRASGNPKALFLCRGNLVALASDAGRTFGR